MWHVQVNRGVCVCVNVHTMFFCKKDEGDNLGLFGTSSYGESTVLKNK